MVPDDRLERLAANIKKLSLMLDVFAPAPDTDVAQSMRQLLDDPALDPPDDPNTPQKGKQP